MKNTYTKTATKTMQDYILEQPEILQTLVDKKNIQIMQRYLEANKIISDEPVDRLVMIASGTSFNAAVTASHYISLPVEVFYPYEFNKYCNIRKYSTNTLFIVISQGGESIESYTALDKAKNHYRTLAVTSDENSTIAKHAHASVLFGCGTETVIFRTKGFTSSVVTLIILAKILAKDNSLSSLANIIPDKRLLLDFMQHTIQFFNCHADAMAKLSDVFFISSGNNIIIGHEAALKAIETIRLPAMSYELEEFVHGPQNAIRDRTQLIIIENVDDTENKAWNLFSALRTLNKNAWFIATRDHHYFAEYTLRRPVCILDEIVTISILQQFCYTVSQRIGVDLTQRGFPELNQYIKKTFI